MLEAQKEKQVQEGKFFALISYISFLCVISLLLKKDNKFALYHAKQGLVLFVFEVAAFILAIIPFLGWLIWILSFIAFTLASLWGILQVLMGEYGHIPVVSKVAKKIVL